MRLYQVTLPRQWSVQVRAQNARRARRLALRGRMGSNGRDGPLTKRVKCVQLAEGIPGPEGTVTA